MHETQDPLTTFVCASFLSLAFLAVVLVTSCSHGPDNAGSGASSLRTAAYVWQRDWSSMVNVAVSRSAPHMDEFMVLVAEISARNGKPRLRAIPVAWEIFSGLENEITPVFRIHDSATPLLSGQRTEEALHLLGNAIRSVQLEARAQHIDLAGIQIDYDCPTSKLPLFEDLLADLKAKFPDLNVSITALPTWLKSRHFAAVCKHVSYFVLQAHSLEQPRNASDNMQICHTDKIAGYLEKADALAVPFYLSLPTYGYRVIFDSQGGFVGLVAEGPLPAWDRGYQLHNVMASPEEMAAMVREISAGPPSHCLGITWFRLPVDSDRMNWSWNTLKTVMQGRDPSTQFQVQVRPSGERVYDVFLTNTGERNLTSGRVRFEVGWHEHAIEAYDILARFKPHRSGQSVTLSGPAPRIGSPLMVGWFRLASAMPEPNLPLTLGDVQIIN